MCRKSQNAVRTSLAGHKGSSLMLYEKTLRGIMRDDNIKNTALKGFVVNDYENGGKHVANRSRESSHRVKANG